MGLASHTSSCTILNKQILLTGYSCIQEAIKYVNSFFYYKMLMAQRATKPAKGRDSSVMSWHRKWAEFKRCIEVQQAKYGGVATENVDGSCWNWQDFWLEDIFEEWLKMQKGKKKDLRQDNKMPLKAKIKLLILGGRNSEINREIIYANLYSEKLWGHK